MSEELLQANGTGGAAALTAKAARSGRHANRKLARKGGGFADALAAVAAGPKAAPKRTAAPAGGASQALAGGASASPLEAKALPANDPSPARAKEAHRRTKGAAPALDAAPGLPVPGEAPKAARTRPAQSRPVADIGSPAVVPDGLPSPASGDRLRANRAAEGIPPAEAARVEGAPRTATPHGAVPPEPTGPTAERRSKDHGRKAEAREPKDAGSPVQPASTPGGAIDPLAAGLMAASATTTALSRPAGNAREPEAARGRHEPVAVSAHDTSATAKKTNERLGDRHEVSGSRSGKRAFDAASPAEPVPAADGPAAAAPSPASAVTPGHEFGQAKMAGHRAARPHAPVGMPAGPAAAPADGAARTDSGATQPIAAEGDIAARNAQGAKAKAQATPDRQATTPGKNASGSTAADAPAPGSRLEGPVTGSTEAAAEPRGAAVAASAPRPVDPSASPAPAAAADALAAADRPTRHAAATAKADASSHGVREAASAAPVAPAHPGDPSGERNDAAAGSTPQPFFAAAAEPARRADGVAPFAPLSDAAPGAPPDFAPLHEQVGMRLSTLPDGAHEVSLQLSPENLGNLRIDLKLSGGRMDAVVRAESPEAREALLRDIPALREALASSGITLSSFDVSLAGGNSPEQHAPRQAGGWETGQGHRSRREGDAESAPGGFRPGRGTSQNETAGAAGGHWIA